MYLSVDSRHLLSATVWKWMILAIQVRSCLFLASRRPNPSKMGYTWGFVDKVHFISIRQKANAHQNCSEVVEDECPWDICSLFLVYSSSCKGVFDWLYESVYTINAVYLSVYNRQRPCKSVWLEYLSIWMVYVKALSAYNRLKPVKRI